MHGESRQIDMQFGCVDPAVCEMLNRSTTIPNAICRGTKCIPNRILDCGLA